MVKNEMSSHNNYRETFWEIAFWCVASSHRVPPFPSWNRLLTLLSWILQSDIWEFLCSHCEKGNILRELLERRFLRDCFLMCDFITQSSNLPFLEPFANTVVVDSAKWHLGAHWGLWWKRKYLHIKTGKKPSGKIHFDLRMQVTELHDSLQWSEY